MKAFLIDPIAKTIEEIEHDGGLETLYRLIGCDTVDAVTISGNIFKHSEALWLDDEGLLKEEDGIPQGFFHWDNYPDPFGGKCLLCGGESDEMADTRFTLDEVRSKVRFVDKHLIEMTTHKTDSGIAIVAVYGHGRKD